MSRQLASRLARLETHRAQAPRCQLVVRYYGDLEPETGRHVDAGGLGAPALVYHRGASWRVPAASC